VADDATDLASEELHRRARELVSAFEAGGSLASSFDALACDLARFQAGRIEGYARLCRARGVDPATLARAEDIPAVPTDAFKVTRVATFDPSLDDAASTGTFRTSGTSQGEAARGVHRMREVSTYDAAAVASGRRWLVRDLAGPVPVIVLGPRPAEARDSSLVHMCEVFARAFGDGASLERTFVVDEGVIDVSTFDERVAFALAAGTPMLVLGTSFAFVHFVDAIGKDSFVLPAGSRVMQTGGYKGRSREVPPDVLRSDLARIFGLERRAIVAEYGMTELSSQFYETSLLEPGAPLGVYAEPPWARVVPVDPDTLAPVPHGEIGIARIVDLMNVDSAVVVLTQDRVRRVGPPGHDPSSGAGFELLGRAPGAPPRGCSIAIDELLGRG